ncbi:MAG: BREX-3 system P-loop-containing protein BrxF [Candidatus Competibacteraceae bacterium]
MATPLSHRIQNVLNDLSGLYYRLALIVGPAGSGKTPALLKLAETQGWPRLNVNRQLAERLLDLTPKQRTVQTASVLEDLVRETAAEGIVLDNLEILFAVDLALDPLRLLQQLSRHRVIVAAWPGGYDGQTLTYAAPGHPEARRYVHPDARIVPAGVAAPLTPSPPGEEC